MASTDTTTVNPPTQDMELRNLHWKWRNPPAEMIAQIPKGNVKLDYLGHAETTAALLESDPMWNWEPMAYDDEGLPLFDVNEANQPVGLWIKLTVHGVTRLGYGSLDRPKPDGRKELIGDALRNAAMRFGVALALWSKSEMRDQAPDVVRDAHPSVAPVTDIKSRTRAKAVKVYPEHGLLVSIYGELSDGGKTEFKDWWKSVTDLGFTSGEYPDELGKQAAEFLSGLGKRDPVVQEKLLQQEFPGAEPDDSQAIELENLEKAAAEADDERPFE